MNMKQIVTALKIYYKDAEEPAAIMSCLGSSVSNVYKAL